MSPPRFSASQRQLALDFADGTDVPTRSRSANSRPARRRRILGLSVFTGSTGISICISLSGAAFIRGPRSMRKCCASRRAQNRLSPLPKNAPSLKLSGSFSAQKTDPQRAQPFDWNRRPPRLRTRSSVLYDPGTRAETLGVSDFIRLSRALAPLMSARSAPAMPELPEVESLRRILARTAIGRTIVRARIGAKSLRRRAPSIFREYGAPNHQLSRAQISDR